MEMICTLLGIVPAKRDLWEAAKKEVVCVNDAHVQWKNSFSVAADKDKDGSPMALLATINSQEPASADAIVSAVQEALSKVRCKDEEEVSVELWATAPAPLPLRPLGGYTQILSAPQSQYKSIILQTLKQYGIILQKKILNAAQLSELRILVNEAISNMDNALATHQPQITVGKDAFCFREIASRSSQRFDLRLNNCDSSATTTTTTAAGSFVEQHILTNATVLELLQTSLAASLEEINYDISVVYSRPGATHQGWHADGNHIKGANDAGWTCQGWKTQLANAYAICLFIPLIDLNHQVGYTQFWPGSHCHRALAGFGPVAEVVGATFDGICNAGDSVWYDYRLLHRGMPNRSSDVTRPVLQIIFKKKWYVERANYGEESVFGSSRGSTSPVDR